MFRLWTHRVFVALAIIQAIRGPIITFQVLSENMAVKPTGAADAVGTFAGNIVGLFVSLVLYLLILIPLVVVAIMTKPPKQTPGQNPNVQDGRQ